MPRPRARGGGGRPRGGSREARSTRHGGRSPAPVPLCYTQASRRFFKDKEYTLNLPINCPKKGDHLTVLTSAATVDSFVGVSLVRGKQSDGCGARVPPGETGLPPKAGA